MVLAGASAVVFPRLLEPEARAVEARDTIDPVGQTRVDLRSIEIRRAHPGERPEDAAGFGTDFVSVRSSRVPAGTYWVRFSVENRGADPYDGQLALRRPLARHLTLFRLDGPDPVLMRGAARLHRTPIAPVRVPARTRATFLAHIDTPSSGLALELWAPTRLADALARGEWALGLMFGILLALTTYYAAVALATRDRGYLPFIGFLAAQVLTAYVVLGFGLSHWGDTFEHATHAVWSVHALSMIALSALLRRFLDLRESAPRLGECLRGLEFGLAGSLLLGPLGYPPPVEIAYALLGVLLTLGLGFSALRALQGSPQAQFLTVGWPPLMLVPLIDVFAAEAMHVTRMPAEVLQMAATALGILGLAFAFAERIAQRRAASDRALRESEERYAYAAAGTNDGLFDWDLDAGTIFLSPRLFETVQHPPGSFTPDPSQLLRLFHEDERDRVRQELLDAFSSTDQESVQFETRIRTANDRVRWVVVRGLLVRDAKGRVTRIVGSFSDIHKRKLHELELQYEAFNDDVTGLANRTYVSQHLETLLSRCEEDPTFAFAVLFVDLDRFKNVNDSLGHIVGDRLLATLGRRLSLVARDGDLVGRLGGDEFVMVVSGRVGPEDAERVARRVLEALEAPVVLEGIEVRTSASIGITHSDVGYGAPQQIFADADMAMYEAKQRGKGRYVSFDSEMRERAVIRLSIEAELRQAIERDEFELYYQPILHADSEALAGFEALIRWNHPKRGLVSPGLFIPVAEETGLIRQIGRFALRQATLQLAEWRQRFDGAEAWFVTVNVSPAQFGHNLQAEVAEVLEATGLPADRLKLEITESLFIGDSGAAQDEMRRLVDFGVKFSLDDFGTGYSSLSYLHQLPFETLKIDRSFVMRLLEDEQSEAIVKSVLALAHGVHMATVAEGVETAEVAARLRTLGVSAVQGYYFGRPEPAAAIEDGLDARGRRASA